MCWGLVTCTGERIPWSACPQANDDKMCECTCPSAEPVSRAGPQVDINLRCYAEVVKRLHLNQTDPTY